MLAFHPIRRLSQARSYPGYDPNVSAIVRNNGFHPVSATWADQNFVGLCEAEQRRRRRDGYRRLPNVGLSVRWLPRSHRRRQLRLRPLRDAEN